MRKVLYFLLGFAIAATAAISMDSHGANQNSYTYPANHATCNVLPGVWQSIAEATIACDGGTPRICAGDVPYHWASAGVIQESTKEPYPSCTNGVNHIVTVTCTANADGVTGSLSQSPPYGWCLVNGQSAADSCQAQAVAGLSIKMIVSDNSTTGFAPTYDLGSGCDVGINLNSSAVGVDLCTLPDGSGNSDCLMDMSINGTPANLGLDPNPNTGNCIVSNTLICAANGNTPGCGTVNGQAVCVGNVPNNSCAAAGDGGSFCAVDAASPPKPTGTPTQGFTGGAAGSSDPAAGSQGGSTQYYDPGAVAAGGGATNTGNAGGGSGSGTSGTGSGTTVNCASGSTCPVTGTTGCPPAECALLTSIKTNTASAASSLTAIKAAFASTAAPALPAVSNINDASATAVGQLYSSDLVTQANAALNQTIGAGACPATDIHSYTLNTTLPFSEMCTYWTAYTGDFTAAMIVVWTLVGVLIVMMG